MVHVRPQYWEEVNDSSQIVVSCARKNQLITCFRHCPETSKIRASNLQCLVGLGDPEISSSTVSLSSCLSFQEQGQLLMFTYILIIERKFYINDSSQIVVSCARKNQLITCFLHCPESSKIRASNLWFLV
ncbi:hypothetical protein AMTRI_Chr10g3660 [Amborella trichopoda]